MKENQTPPTLNLSISIWLMSSDWGRDLSVTRLRRAGGLSVSSGTSSVSWDSELSPPAIVPPLLPPVNAPPDTIYVIRAKGLRIFSLFVCNSLDRTTREFREMVQKDRNFKERSTSAKDRSLKACLDFYSNVPRTRRVVLCQLACVIDARKLVISVSSHLDLYTAVSAVTFGVSCGFVALLPLFAASPNERSEPRDVRSMRYSLLDASRLALRKLSIVWHRNSVA
jgi:hypothetical protein